MKVLNGWYKGDAVLRTYATTKQLFSCCTQEIYSSFGLTGTRIRETTHTSTPPARAVEAGVAAGVEVQVWNTESLVQLGALQPHLVLVEPGKGIKQLGLAGFDILHYEPERGGKSSLNLFYQIFLERFCLGVGSYHLHQ